MVSEAGGRPAGSSIIDKLVERWPLVLGLALLCIPALVELGRQAWTRENGVHGPLILATWVWLLWRGIEEAQGERRPGRLLPAMIVLLPALALFIGAWAFDFISLIIVALVTVIIVMLYLELGGSVARQIWFPLAYGYFLVPPPGYAVDTLTLPLKSGISQFVSQALYGLGYPIVHSGVSLYIAQYQLLVEDACSGLSSMFSLLALGLFYVYLMHRSNWRYAVVLALFIIPAAILANLIRVLLIVLITYYFGNEVAQGVIHETTGMLLFIITLLSVFLIDKLLTPLRHRLEVRRA